MNPECLARLTHEVRSTFTAEEEITIASVSTLPYMLACLDEALRCYPPIASGLPRVVAKGGRTLCGQYVPEDVSFAIVTFFVASRPSTDTTIHRPTWLFGNGRPLTTKTTSSSRLPTDRSDGSRARTRNTWRISASLCSPSRLAHVTASAGSKCCALQRRVHIQRQTSIMLTLLPLVLPTLRCEPSWPVLSSTST